MDTAYRAWYLTEGSARGNPLDEDTLREDARVLDYVSRDGLDLDACTVQDVKLYLVERKARGEVGAGRLNNISKALRRWLRYRIGKDVHLPTWSEPHPKEKALDAGQKWTALQYHHDVREHKVRNRFLAYFAMASGVEPAEACRMNVEDFDVERMGVHVEHPCKGHRRGFVPLPANVLTNPRRPSFASWMKYRRPPKGDERAVFTSADPRRASMRATAAMLSRALQEVRRETGVPINWQVTRHTCATDLLEAGFPERYVMKVLRLSSLTHVPRYAEARDGPLERKYRALRGMDPYARSD